MIDPIIKVRVPKTLERKEVQRLINTESGSYEIHQAAFGRSAFESSPNGKANGKSNGHANGSVANFPSPYASPKTKSQGKRKHKRLDGPQEVISQNGSFPPRPFHAPKHSGEVSSVSTATGVLQPAEEIELEGVSQTPVKRKRLKIPLEKFDDPALEVLTPSISQWLEENRGEGGIKAKSKYYDTDGTFCWATCTVTGYDEETSLFDIVWDQSGGKKKVRRFNLIFKDEDVAHFQKRIRLAKELEAEMGSRMRIQNLIASQEFKNSEMIDDNFKRRILEKYEIPHASTFPNIAEVFFKESKDIYKHAMKTAVFKYLLPDEDDQQQEMEDRESINLDHLLHEDQVPIQGCVPLHLLHPQDGMEATCRPDDEEVQTSQLALESFEDQLFTISNALGLAQEDILSCLQQFYHELDVKDQILVTQYEEMLLEAPFDLRHFETLQSRHMNDMADTLRHDWVLRVATKVEDIPYISGSIDDQLFARTVKRISLLMADSLRISALQSLSAYTNIWKKYDIDFDLLSQGVKDKDSIGLVPLFRMEMTISEGGRFELPLDELKEKILFFYDEIISSVNGIDDIGSKITILDAPEKHMETISHDEPNVVEVRDTISEIIDKNLKGLRELLDSFNGFEDLATAEVATHIENWTANPLSLTSCQEEVKRFLDLKKSIEEKCENQTLFPMIVVNSAEAKAFLENKALELRSALLRLTCDNWCASNETICKRYDALKEKMASSPDTTEELDELRRFFDASKNELEELESDINASSELYLVFNDSRFTLTVQEHDLYWDVFGWPKKLASVVEQGEVNLNEKTEKFKQELVDNRAKLVEDVVQMGKDVDEFIQLGEIELVEERVVTVSEIEAKLKQASTLAEVYRNHESIFGMPEQDLPQLDRLVKTFEPYCNLWKICGDFTNHLPEWTDGPFTELDPESLTNSIENWIRALAKVQKVLSERAAEACKILNERLNKFQEYLPLIAALRNPGLRERHWKRMSKDLGFPVKVDVSFSLSRALQLQLLEHMEVIEEISEYASKEYSLEKTLDKMQHEWSGVSFDRMDWRDTGTTILRGIDDIQAILDDQVVKTQAMRASPYIGAFEERVKLWEKRLNNVQETIDEWLKCQQQWLYLEPIFGSDDIMQQMPNEGRKFKTVDGTWRKTMEKVEKNSEVLTVCSDDELLKNLIDANKLLDAVQKGLNDYLETKRLAFPRFYFLSNEELLEILSETKDPLRVQPFLKKIFEGINKIHFEEDLTVTAMISAEGEQVQLRNTFNPSSAGGNVERWLIDLKASMRDSVKHVTKQSFDAYATTDRNKWVIEWPGQVVICVDSLYWTDETEEAISDGKLPEYALKCTAQLKDIVDKVRGKLTKLERKTLSSLIVIDVHARDVIARLADLNIIAVSDFEWQSQLRYEWDGSEVLVRMINAQLYYGYEYLGLPSRLVITPLTDRCYRTLMGALHLDLFDWMVDPCIRFVRRNCKEVVGTADINLVQSTMRLISSLLLKMLQENPKAEMTQEILESIFIFSLVWGIGASIDGNGRMLFDPFVKKLFAKEVDKSTDRKDYDLGAGLEITYPEVDTKCTLPLEESLYDYEYNFEHFKWVNWMGTTAKQEIKPTAQFQEIIVKTVDTVRYVYLLKTLISNTVHSLVVGQTGTGKTVYVKEVLGNSLDKATYQNIQTSFSARTNANQIQDLIDGKLDKRRKGVFGPPFGTKCVIFVDDLNMPQLEVYGAQPPIEILRQWMDHGGWYERSDNTFKSLVDIQFVAAMGPPGGGRNAVTPRYMRHFNVIAISEFSDQTFQHIYEVIVEWWMAKVRAEEAALEKMTPIVKATVRIYNTIKAELLPTPSKSHYVYNMRDLSKVFQGMQTINHQLKDEKHLLRLWTHEVLRVFNDRLTNDDDKMWFTGLMNKVLEEDVGVTFSSLVDIEEETDDLLKEDMNQFLFCNFLQQGKDGNPKYEEVLQRQKLLQVIDESLGDYNAQHKSKMNLVMFSYAAEHIARISRIIQQPYGNALLVGMGGSGRQSLTRIATFIADFKLRQVEITKSYGIIEWREDLKDILRKSGGEGSPTVFLFTDSQIKDESFMEDINNILNTGEIPGLYPKDEIMSILEMVRPRAKRVGKDKSVADLYDFFVEQCRYNLHTVVCMSPVGDAFRSRLRMFPSLVNCCTIDWFSEWPQDALKSVATQFLAEVDLSTPELRSACEDMCIEFHVKIRQLATKFLEEERRYYYATPTSYLELINTYKKLLKAKRLEVSTIRDRYEIGLEKLLNAEESVSVMKEELIALQPVLVKTSEEVEETLKVVDKETEQAEAKRAVVEKEEAVANVKAQAAKAIKDECEAELAEAIPLLEAAISALNTLTKNDITLVKSMKNPPVAIKTVMETVCIMLEVKPKRINDPNNPVKKIDDYWSPSQGLLGDSTFLATLQKYDKDNIKPAIITKIRPFLDREDFQPENVKKAAKAAYGLCQWVRAMEAYDRVAKVVAPKKQKLAESEAEYALLNESLQKKKAELKEVQDRLESLQNKLQELLAKKKQLEIDVDQCKKKLDRAEKLIGGLGGEKTRWSAVAAKLKEDFTNLTGDVLLSSSFVAYLGAFTTEYREDAIGGWVKLCVERGIPCSGEDFSLLTVLGDQVQMRDWAIEGLPNDFLSIENAIIMSKATRWPLMIDPQGQANKWIKNKEKQASLEVLKLNDSDYIRKLENSIQFGFPVLLENVGEELDATLEPLLTRSTFKQGGSICIKLGDSVIEYNPKFHFYVTTKLTNPHYLPEISVKVTLLNFMITQKGLEDQLLALTVSMERPELEEEKVKLVLQSAENARQLKEIEDKIIEILSTSEGNILEDETAINVITSSKQLSTEIDVKQQIAKKTEKQIDEARLEYKEVATYASHLFFCVSSLANLEPMYQYSLPWFIMLFTNTIKNADKHDVLSDRILALNDYFTGSLFSQVCRSLFEKDKLLFGFALCISIYGHNLGQISLEQFRFLITGGVEISSGFDEQPDKKPAWLSKKSWIEFVKLATFYDKYKGISDHIAENADSWKVLWDVPDPTSTPLPDPWESKLDTFEKLLVTRCIRPDKLPVAVQNFLMGKMGKKYVESPPFDLSGCYNDSLATVPLVFILSPGSDPMSSLLSFADGLKTPVSSISLGQGQGPKAEKMIKDAQSSGEWVVLQNCHLAVSWMSSLEEICENVTMENTNPNFRLWLTSYPSEHFPVSILQNSVKMTNEPPKGLRANLLQTYSSNPLSDPAFFEGCGERSPEFKKLLFGLCTFHAIVQERLSFGPIGWNVKYQFSTPDFVISVRQLQMFLNEYPEDLPLQALIYLTGECNYGGRVTDAKDRRTLMSILDVFYNFDVFNDEYTFSSSGNYYAPPDGEYPSYIEFIKKLPLTSAPEAFGLHANADITKDQKETDLFLASLATSQSTASGGANKGKDAALKEIVQVVKNKMPEPFDLEYANYKYPVMYLESMNTVLCQEMVRFNRLIEVIKKSIADLAKALEGLVVMSGDLEALGNSMYDGKIPALWAGKSYPSLKPLPSYVDDLCKRLKMLQDWLDDGPPNVFWISGFYFTHAFLTGIKQNFARRNKIPIDTLGFDYTCQPIREVTEKHEVGAFVNGMFLEGARWDYDAFQLEDSEPKVLYSEAPMLLVEPVELTKRKSFPHYECPLYRTTERKGTLATTGHSTNFVMDIQLPSDRPQDYWIRGGVALLLELSE